jgi:uncharacterized protein YbjT (DUF2867 family)
MILVTGATGHTGSYLVRRLVESGRQVRCLVRTPGHDGYLPQNGEEIVRGDFSSPETIRASLDHADALVNVAHIRFAHALIPLCKETGVRRALFMSSTRRYTRYPCTSATEVIEGEEAVRKSGLDYTILRPSMIYGGPRDNNMTKLVSQLRSRRIFPLFGNGKNLIQPVFVLDLVDALIHCLEHPDTIGREYILAGPLPMTYRQCLDIIARQLNKKPLFIPVPLGLCVFAARLYEKMTNKPRVTAEQVQRFGEDKAFDIEPAKREIGFAPRSFEEGIRMKLAGEV